MDPGFYMTQLPLHTLPVLQLLLHTGQIGTGLLKQAGERNREEEREDKESSETDKKYHQYFDIQTVNSINKLVTKSGQVYDMSNLYH